MLNEVTLSHKDVFLNSEEMLLQLKLIHKNRNDSIIRLNRRFFHPLLEDVEALSINDFQIAWRKCEFPIVRLARAMQEVHTATNIKNAKCIIPIDDIRNLTHNEFVALIPKINLREILRDKELAKRVLQLAIIHPGVHVFHERLHDSLQNPADELLNRRTALRFIRVHSGNHLKSTHSLRCIADNRKPFQSFLRFNHPEL